MARMMVTAPAIFMILNGLLGLVLLGLLSVPFVFDINMPIVWAKDMVAQQPAGPEKQANEQKIAEAEAQLQQHGDDYIRQNAVILSIGALLNLTAVIGGLYMRSLSGYTLSMLGGIVSVIPIATGCCITGIPFGAWVLVVLSRPEVKAAFVARRNTPPPNPDEQYMR
jgi:hypothetical protein